MKLKATSGSRKPVMIIRIIKSPITAISKALDIYSKCMISFSVNYNKPFMIMEDTPNSQQKIPNRRNILSETNRHPGALMLETCTTATATATATRVTNHSSVGDTAMMWPSPRMKTIHEDRACSFRDDDGVVCKKIVTNKICFVVKSVCR